MQNKFEVFNKKNKKKCFMVYNLGDTWKCYWKKNHYFSFNHVRLYSWRAHYKSTTKFLLLINFFTCFNFYVNFSLDGGNRFEIVSLIEYTIFGLKVFVSVGLFRLTIYRRNDLVIYTIYIVFDKEKASHL